MPPKKRKSHEEIKPQGRLRPRRNIVMEKEAKIRETRKNQQRLRRSRQRMRACILCGDEFEFEWKAEGSRGRWKSRRKKEEEARDGIHLLTQVIFQKKVEEMPGSFGDVVDWGLSVCDSCWPQLDTVRGWVVQMQDLANPLAGLRTEVEDLARANRRMEEKPMSSSPQPSLKDTLLRLLNDTNEGEDGNNWLDSGGDGNELPLLVSIKNEHHEENVSMEEMENMGWFGVIDEDNKDEQGPSPRERNKSHRISNIMSKTKRMGIPKGGVSDLNRRRKPRVRPFRCPVKTCEIYFETEAIRDAHHKRRHLGIRLAFECNECKKTFTRSDGLLTHTRKFCPVVNRIKNLSREPKPRKARTGETKSGLRPKYCCSICQDPFNEISLLQEHVASHPGDQQIASAFACFFCDNTFDSSRLLESHVDDVHLCLHCNKHYRNPANHMQRVRYKATDFICKHCDSKFLKKSTLLNHMVFKHHEALGLEPFECTICEGGKKFESCGMLRFHVTQRHDIDPPPPIMCNECGRSFYHNSILILHKKSHDDPGEPVCCETCEKFFQSTLLLRQHVARCHTTKVEVICELCGTVKPKNNMRRHKCLLRSDEEKKNRGDSSIPPVCEMCGLKFLNRQSLLLHMRFHKPTSVSSTKRNRPLNFICSVCQVRFPQLYTLNKHLFNAHQMPPILPVTTSKRRPYPGRGSLSASGHDSSFTPTPASFDPPKVTIQQPKTLLASSSPGICEICGLKFLNQHALRLHKIVHRSTKVPKRRPIHYICSVCQVRFPFRQKLNEHLAAVHQLPPTDRMKPRGGRQLRTKNLEIEKY